MHVLYCFMQLAFIHWMRDCLFSLSQNAFFIRLGLLSVFCAALHNVIQYLVIGIYSSEITISVF